MNRRILKKRQTQLQNPFGGREEGAPAAKGDLPLSVQVAVAKVPGEEVIVGATEDPQVHGDAHHASAEVLLVLLVVCCCNGARRRELCWCFFRRRTNAWGYQSCRRRRFQCCS